MKCTEIIFLSCDTPGTTRGNDILSPADSLQLALSVGKAVWTFYSADTARNAEAVIELLWPEFTMMADGQRVAFDDAVKGIRAFLRP